MLKLSNSRDTIHVIRHALYTREQLASAMGRWALGHLSEKWEKAALIGLLSNGASGSHIPGCAVYCKVCDLFCHYINDCFNEESI